MAVKKKLVERAMRLPSRETALLPEHMDTINPQRSTSSGQFLRREKTVFPCLQDSRKIQMGAVYCMPVAILALVLRMARTIPTHSAT